MDVERFIARANTFPLRPSAYSVVNIFSPLIYSQRFGRRGLLSDLSLSVICFLPNNSPLPTNTGDLPLLLSSAIGIRRRF